MHLHVLFFFAICIAVGNVRSSNEHTAMIDSTSSVNETTESNVADNATQDDDQKEHHDHEATVSIDLHKILDLFKQQLKNTEQRIIAAVGKDENSSSPSRESYRTADRNIRKQDKKNTDEQQHEHKSDGHDDDDNDD